MYAPASQPQSSSSYIVYKNCKEILKCYPWLCFMCLRVRYHYIFGIPLGNRRRQGAPFDWKGFCFRPGRKSDPRPHLFLHFCKCSSLSLGIIAIHSSFHTLSHTTLTFLLCNTLGQNIYVSKYFSLPVTSIHIPVCHWKHSPSPNTSFLQVFFFFLHYFLKLYKSVGWVSSLPRPCSTTR